MNKYFQNCGLVLGFISYPYDIDGRSLYKDIFKKQFFKKYKEGINKYSVKKLSKHLYNPKGYRIFGNYGLVILSLIDDFAFCDRIFHANNGYREDHSEYNDTSKYRYYTWVITGITANEKKRYLKKKAENTFLKKKDRYPFMGTIKLKINNNLIYGKGVSVTNAIKDKIDELSKTLEKNERFDSIAIDCFDNDELTVISFSNSLSVINHFFSQIRDLTRDDIDSKNGDNEHQHVFLSGLTHLGYDSEYTFGPTIEECTAQNPRFIPVKDIDQVRIRVIWETRIGHHNMFKACFEKEFPEFGRTAENTLTGGNAMSHQFPLWEIRHLEEFCVKAEFKHHVKKVRIILNWKVELDYELPEKTGLAMRNGSGSLSHLAFTSEYLKEIRDLLNECRVSKIQRERLLKIYGLFNESIRDILHSGYFSELRQAMSNIKNILIGFTEDDQMKIEDIDFCLSEIIISLEEAYYNRFHQKGMKDTNLEYNGGIQQHLTSYDFAYKEILRILSPGYLCNSNKESVQSFISISGYEKVASIRMNLRININQISYPELYAISVWKEACNFTYPLSRRELEEDMGDPRNEDEKVYYRKYSAWSKFKERDQSFVDIRTVLTNEDYFDVNDDTYRLVSNLLEKKAIQYFFIDAFSYHFGFHQNYELFYHSYWKYFLQISQHYNRKGKIDKAYFVSYLLRIFMIGFRLHLNYTTYKAEQMTGFLLKQRFKPFDPVLSDLWLACYEKVYACALTIWKELNRFYFEEITNKEINLIEKSLASNPDLATVNSMAEDKYDKIFIANSIIVDERKVMLIDKLKTRIMEGRLAQMDENEEVYDDYIICLFNAYLLAIKELDEKGVDERVLKCIPRDPKGQILLKENDDNDPLKKIITNLPVDPLGGIFITNSNTRGEYFHYRTSFYRSLWDYTMRKRTK